MSTEEVEGEESLLPIYTQPFMFEGIVWSAHTTPAVLQKCLQFAFRSDDIVIATYPRSGTTIAQEIVWHIVNHESIRKGVTNGAMTFRFPFLELDFGFKGIAGKPNSVDSLPTWTKQRLIKTHLPYSFIRNEFEKVNPKLIVVMRNPKDCVVSQYYFYMGHKFIKDQTPFSEHFKAFMTDKEINGNFCDFNLQWWALRDRENVLIVRYEDLVRQPFQEVRKIALFLGYSLSAEKVATIVHNTTFDAMSKNEEMNINLKTGVHSFLRKGKVGEWKDWLTVAQDEAMESWIRDRLIETGLNFIYE